MTNLCDNSSRWDCIFIYIFQTFEARTRANQANITGLGTFDLWHAFHIRKATFKASRIRFSDCQAALLATKSRWVFMPRAKFYIRRKASSTVKNITWECKQQISVGSEVQKEILSSQYDSSIVLWRKNRWCSRVHTIGTLSL